LAENAFMVQPGKNAISLAGLELFCYCLCVMHMGHGMAPQLSGVFYYEIAICGYWVHLGMHTLKSGFRLANMKSVKFLFSCTFGIV
jgi:hypothetical protein